MSRKGPTPRRQAEPCTHPGAQPGLVSHFGKTVTTIHLTLPYEAETVDGEPPRIGGAVQDDLYCTTCGDSVRIRVEPVVMPAWQQDVAVAMERFTGRKQLAVCEFVSRSSHRGQEVSA